MFIAIIDFEVAPENRHRALDALNHSVDDARRMDGNMGYRAFADSMRDTHVGILHEWTEEATFDAYLASDLFKRLGADLRPLMTAPPVSRRFRAELVQEVKG